MPLYLPNGGLEVAYAEITSVATTTSTSLVDVTGLSFTVVVADRPVVLEFQGQVRQSLTDVSTGIAMLEGTNQICFGYITACKANGESSFQLKRRLSTAGSYAIKIQWQTVSSGTSSIICAATSPATLQAVEV